MCCYEWLWCSISALRTQLIPLASSCISCCRHLLDIFGADPPAAFTNRFVYLQSWPCVCSGDYRQKCLPVCRSQHHKMVCGVIFWIILFVWNHFLWICSVLCRGRTRVSCESSTSVTQTYTFVMSPWGRYCLLTSDFNNGGWVWRREFSIQGSISCYLALRSDGRRVFLWSTLGLQQVPHDHEQE